MRGCGLTVIQTFGGLGLTDTLRELIGKEFNLSRRLCTLYGAVVAETVFVPLALVRTQLQLDICRRRLWSSPLHCLRKVINTAKALPGGGRVSNVTFPRVFFRGAIPSVFIGTIQKCYFFQLYDANFRHQDSIGRVRALCNVPCLFAYWCLANRVFVRPIV